MQLAFGASGFLPRQRYRAVPWGAADVLLVLAFALLVPSLLFSVWRMVPGLRDDPRLPLFVAVQGGTVTFICVPFVLRKTSGAQPYQLGLVSSNLGRDAVLGVATYVLAVPAVFATAAFVSLFAEFTPHAIEQMYRGDPSLSTRLLGILAAVVVAPLSEELLFRGVVQPWLRRLLGVWPAIVVTSLAFALLHSNFWPAPVPLFVFALFLGYLAHRTSSIVAPIVLHATFNGVTMFVLVMLVRHGK